MPQCYVYPVRSLLSGIQAAAETNPDSESEHTADPSAESCKTSPTISTPPLMESGSNDSHLSSRVSTDRSGEGESSSVCRRVSTRLKRCTGRRGIDPLHYKLDDDQKSSRREHKRAPNFIDYPRDQDPLAPRTFVSGLVSPPAETSRLGTLPGPMGEPIPFDPKQLSDDADDYIRSPRDLSEVAADAFAVAIEDAVPPASPMTADKPMFSNFSQSGIVHLAPIERDGSPKSRTHSAGSNSGSGSGAATSRAGTSKFSGGGSSTSNQSEVVQMPSTRSTRPPSASSGSANASSQSTSEGSSSEGPHITFRYQHVEDENGHHLIVGREGTLTQCEDEPIRTPGAVQGFGVLVAIQEDEETGNLVVRQVSEV